MATKAGRYDEVLFSTHGTSGTIKAMNADTVQVEVFKSDGTTNATLYDDRNKTAYSGTGSIVTPDSAGNIEFFADPGIYVLKISDDGTVLRTDTVNVSVDGVEAADFPSLASDETVTGAWSFGTANVDSLRTKGPAFDVTHPDFGAVGDGTTDDSTAVSAAFAAAASGGTVLFPAGKNFRLASQVNVTTDDITVDARGATISADTDNIILLSFNGVNGVTVLGGTWDLNGAVGDDSRHAIRINTGSSDALISGAEFINCVGFAVGVYGSDASVTERVRLESCRFDGTLAESVIGEGDVYVQGARRVQHVGNIHTPDATNPSPNGVAVVGDTGIHWLDVEVSGNTMDGHAWRGVSISDEDPVASFDCGIARIAHNTIRNVARQGIKCKNAPRLVVTDNYLEATDSSPESASLRGAINCHSASDFLIADNIIVDAGTDGVRVEGASTAIGGSSAGVRRAAMRIAGNTINSPGEDGIHVSQRCYDVVVEGNIVRNPSQSAVDVTGTNAAAEDHCRNVVVADNVVYNATSQALVCTYVDRLQVTGNIIDTVAHHGIQFSNVTDAAVHRNIIRDADIDGVLLSSGDQIDVTHNLIDGPVATRWGINNSAATNVRAFGNTINAATGSVTGTVSGAGVTYTPTNVTTDRSYDADATTLAELADVVGTLVADLQSIGLLG